jgi:hypothetical protein
LIKNNSLKNFIRRACGSADFFGGEPDEKSPFQGEKCGFDVANAHKFLKISD